MDDKRHDTRGQDVVAHPCVPGEPHLLEVAELDIVLGDLLKGAPVRVLRHWRQDRGRVPGIVVRLRFIRLRGLSGAYMLPACSDRERRCASIPGRKEGKQKTAASEACSGDWRGAARRGVKVGAKEAD